MEKKKNKVPAPMINGGGVLSIRNKATKTTVVFTAVGTAESKAILR